MTDGTTAWAYTYDVNGMRLLRTNGTKTYWYLYNGDMLRQMTITGGVSLSFVHNADGPMIIGYSGTSYYYVRNLQGDIIAIVNPDGEAVVEYTYDAWGKILSITGSMADTLGQYNPFRYRGYVYDPDTGLYYLQSRYYDPEMGRFINADALVSTGQGLLGNNMFSYCVNNPCNYIDSAGTDAIWIQEGGSAKGAGHSGLLIQDEDGNWFYFFWGPENENASIGELIGGTKLKMIVIQVYPEESDLSSPEAINAFISSIDIEEYPEADQENAAFVRNRGKLITGTIYLSGDYTNTYDYLDQLQTDVTAKKTNYNLLFNNCVQQTCMALAASDHRFGSLSPLIPNNVYAEVFDMHYSRLMYKMILSE